MAEIKEKVVQIIAEQLDVGREQITDDATFEALGADSLDIAEMVMEFEESFGINIPEDEEGIKTVGDAVKYIEKHS